MNYIDGVDCKICLTTVTKIRNMNNTRCNCLTIDVHDDCLLKWLTTKDEKNHICEICKSKYNYSRYLKIRLLLNNYKQEKNKIWGNLMEELKNKLRNKYITEEDILKSKKYMDKKDKEYYNGLLIYLMLSIIFYNYLNIYWLLIFVNFLTFRYLFIIINPIEIISTNYYLIYEFLEKYYRKLYIEDIEFGNKMKTLINLTIVMLIMRAEYIILFNIINFINIKITDIIM